MTRLIAFASLLLVTCPLAGGQSNPARQSFEVAYVHVSKSGVFDPFPDIMPGGRVELHGVTMTDMLWQAYYIRRDLILGAPKWFDSDHFDVVAKADVKTTISDLRAMLQTLLADRFGLALHREQKVLPVYALVVSKRGPKLVASHPESPGRKGCLARVKQLEAGLGREDGCVAATMDDFAEHLQMKIQPRIIDRPVVNRTGIDGAFDFKLDWSPAATMGSADATGETLFDALESQLGLRLEPQKQPVPVLVIDHATRMPTDN